MSLLLTTSPKHCANKGLNLKKLINKKLLYFLSTFFLSILSIVILIWFILHPSKPEFYLQNTDIYQLSLSSPHLLNSTIEATLLSKNPNTRVGIYYDKVRVFATYKGQQITGDSELPSFYQGHEESNFLSTALYGNGMPVYPLFGYEVSRDQTTGKLIVDLKLDGQLRWKVGMWVSGRYRFDVDCTAAIGIKQGDAPGPLSLVEGTQCSITV
ncbi:Late embryogenesis abundant protein LEA-2 subgroup domain-containing protein [Dioscorea alata]|uniref:Late embryogenesis abundant protein LEA-2 subgroup domain-containing protein n=1 Tax=Dioscorea alata TaxID=55571 RepID=A0ACB7WG63_DIOAL|nr:Late embryogenesis abundant protein LEA-2 subgroup domain-containing protein [Dioscorea alata]